MFNNIRTALIIDSLCIYGGAERMLNTTLKLFPQVDIYTLVYDPRYFNKTLIRECQVHTSFVNRLPGAQKYYRQYLPLLPYAIEQFDLSDYDLLLSFSYAVAHGVIPQPGQLHISYLLTPLRYAWQDYHRYVNGNGSLRGKSWLAKLTLHYLRIWSVSASARVDRLITASKWGAECAWRAFRRESTVIYPPVDVERFSHCSERANYYLTVARLVPQKKVAMIVECFVELGLPLVVIGDGPEFNRIRKLTSGNIHLMGWQSDDIVRDFMSQAKGFVHAAEEDFGITLVEAQASGCPVIAYRGGGAKETVIDQVTGIFFEHQTKESLSEAIIHFEKIYRQFDISDLRQNCERFNQNRYLKEISAFILNTLEKA